MRLLTVSGLNADGTRLVLRAGTEVFELDLADVPQGRQPALPFAGASPPTPREIQLRLRRGESVQQIAEDSGLPHDAVDRYAGPVLAERELQATRARGAVYDGRVVEELVLEHLDRLGADPADVALGLLAHRAGAVGGAGARRPGTWSGSPGTPPGARSRALDEASRAALRRSPLAHDALEEILAPARSTRPPSRPRLGVVPLWDDDQAADGLRLSAPGAVSSRATPSGSRNSRIEISPRSLTSPCGASSASSASTAACRSADRRDRQRQVVQADAVLRERVGAGRHRAQPEQPAGPGVDDPAVQEAQGLAGGRVGVGRDLVRDVPAEQRVVEGARAARGR